MTGETWTRGDWMQTLSGRRYYPRNPSPDDIDPGDISHALSMLCRYAGHVERFYSVAEHSVLMSQAVAPEHALAALLHDATEAYLVDVPRPVKRYLPEYVVLEQMAWTAICMRFGLELDLPAEVKQADTRILIPERNTLMPRAERWAVDEDFEPLPVTIEGWDPTTAELRFSARFLHLLGVAA